MSTLEDIRNLIHSLVKQLHKQYDLLKDAKKQKASQQVIDSINDSINHLKKSLQKARNFYNTIKIKESKRKEETEDVTEDIRYLFETYPYYESQRFFPSSIGMYIIDMKGYTTGNFSRDVSMLEEPLKAVLKEAYNTYGPFKFLWRMNNTVRYVNGSEEDIEYFQPKSHPYTVLNPQEIDEEVKNIIQYVDDLYLPSLEGTASGFSYEHGNAFYVDIYKYEPLAGSKYIELPTWIKNSKSCINIKNDDDKCFLWCHLRHKHENKKHPNLISDLKQYVNELDISMLTFPVKDMKEVDKFDMVNGTSTYIYYIEGDVIHPYHKPKHKNGDLVDLGLVVNHKNEMHYVLIKDFNRLIGSKYKWGNRMYICRECFYITQYEDVFKRHVCYHGDDKGMVQFLPKTIKVKDVEVPNKLKFVNYKKIQYEHFFVIGDIESIIKPINDKTSEHIPFAINAIFVSPWGIECIGPFLSSNPVELMNMFKESLVVKYNQVKEYLEQQQRKPIVHKAKEIEDYKKVTHCWICGDLLSDDRVYDYDNVTLEYRGISHKQCNTKLRLSLDQYRLKILFHNAMNYDHHLILKYMPKDVEFKSPISKSIEKFLSFKMNVNDAKFEFGDTYQYLQGSLESLVEQNSKNGVDEDSFPVTYKIFRRIYGNNVDVKFIIRKGCFPYEWLDDYNKLQSTALPSIEFWTSKLTGKSVSNEDYQYALKIWDMFNCKTVADYLKVYLISDTVLLTDIINNTRKLYYSEYKLELLHYKTLPSFSLDAMLKYSKIELGYIHTHDQLNIIRSGIRGGINGIGCINYAKADLKTSHILYLDVNNLYGAAMCSYLFQDIIGDVEFVKEEDSERVLNEILSLPDEGDIGAKVVVDIMYPKHLHKLHNQYPLAPIHKKFKDGIKLIQSLEDKIRYSVCYRNLKYYVSKGLKVTRVHEILRFRQAPFVKDYIMKNAKLRLECKTEIGKNSFKLMNNAIYGKFLENVFKHQNVDFITDTDHESMNKKILKKIRSPQFHHIDVINEYRLVGRKNKTKFTINKPIYIGDNILDQSKLIMFKLFYDHLLPHFGDRMQLIYTDTDSLVLYVQSDNIAKDLYELRDILDLSCAPPSYYLPDVDKSEYMKNKGVIGKLKLESGLDEIIEFGVDRPKQYYMKTKSGKTNIKAKGIQKCVINNNKDEIYKIMDEVRKDPTKEGDIIKQTRLVSKQQTILTIEQQRAGINARDNKKVRVDDKFYAYGYRNDFKK